MKNFMRFLGIAAIVFSTAFMVTSCSEKSETGKALEKVAEDAKKNGEKAVEDLKKAAEDGKKEAEKALDKADKEAAKAIDNLTT